MQYEWKNLQRLRVLSLLELLEIYIQTRYVVNFHTEMSSSQSEERTMFFTRIKKVRKIKGPIVQSNCGLASN